MADASFDRARFESALATERLGRTLELFGAVGSTNDACWEARERGAGHGRVVIAEAQTRGRGRSGRVWHIAPGRALALSLLLTECAARPLGVVPLAAGLALVRSLGDLGIHASLKWPNDVRVGRGKVAGILCESRVRGDGERAVVVGVGVNVSQRRQDFPAELREIATSLALEGHALEREALAARWLDRFEALWHLLGEVGAAPVIHAWQETASFWGHAVRVRAPGGEVSGVALRLDPEGCLVIRGDDGAEIVVMAGDLAIDRAAGGARR